MSKSKKKTGSKAGSPQANVADAESGTLRLRLFAGSRATIDAKLEYTLDVTDGTQQKRHSKKHKGAAIDLSGLPVKNNFTDNYVVSVAAKSHRTVGEIDVRMKAGSPTDLSLMLVNKDADFNFRDALWDRIRQRPLYDRLLADTTEEAYTAELETPARQAPMACLFNLLTAMEQIQLIHGTAADLIREIDWRPDQIRQDRVFVWAEPELEIQVRRSSDEGGVFAPDAGGGVLHPGSTSSYRQQELDGTNLQVSFHANDAHPAGKNLIRTELDIDYFRDPLAHLLLEVFVNQITQSRTDPRNVYVMRWSAGLKEGLPNFNPPYCLV